ncbi:hypothetical protein RB2083_3041 [Rhodobacteraceae bacterium HTCC2083]|nr:hypothetical protein RB2083_3041 [Rhodobacteraceae bacterium HTCC2083]
MKFSRHAPKRVMKRAKELARSLHVNVLIFAIVALGWLP